MIVADDIAAKRVASRRVTVGRCDLGDSSSVGLALADLEVALDVTGSEYMPEGLTIAVARLGRGTGREQARLCKASTQPASPPSVREGRPVSR